jgi:hypothetical protein
MPQRGRHTTLKLIPPFSHVPSLSDALRCRSGSSDATQDMVGRRQLVPLGVILLGFLFFFLDNVRRVFIPRRLMYLLAQGAIQRPIQPGPTRCLKILLCWRFSGLSRTAGEQLRYNMSYLYVIRSRICVSCNNASSFGWQTPALIVLDSAFG